MRPKILQIAIGAVFLFIVASLAYTQIIRGSRYRTLSQKNSIRIIPKAAPRGRILDRNNQILVDNGLAFNVAIIPEGLKDKHKTFNKLAEILGLGPDKISARYKKNYIAPFAPIVVAKDVTKEKAIIVEENKMSLEGTVVNLDPERRYPFGRLASHIFGHLGSINPFRLSQWKDYGYSMGDLVGYSGVEEYYDNFLKPEDGGLQVEVDHRSRLVSILGIKAPKEGRDIQLTIDLRMQQIVEEALGDNKGAAIIMQPYTGEILAMVSFPNFNPALFLSKDSKSSLAFQDILTSPEAPLLNRAISGLYPPASVFKIVVATAGLETKKISPESSFLCTGSTRIGNREFLCWSSHGTQNLFEAIGHSCDTYFYRLGILLGPDVISDYAKKFSLDKATGVDIPNEKKGFVPTRLWRRLSRQQTWYDGDTANFAIGQGDLLVTPIEVVRMMAVFANEGYLVNPYLVKAIDNKEVLKPKPTKLALRDQTMRFVRLGLKMAVQDAGGTAHILSLDNLEVAGKTGTAQVSKGAAHGWFVGFCPFEKTKIVICVFLEHGTSGYHACLIAKKILERMLEAGLL